MAEAEDQEIARPTVGSEHIEGHFDLRKRLLRDFVSCGVVEYSSQLSRRGRIVIRQAALRDGEGAREGAIGALDQAGYDQCAADQADQSHHQEPWLLRKR